MSFCFFLFTYFASGKHDKNTANVMLENNNEGWTDEDGQAVDLYDIAPGRHSVILDISDLDTDGKAICFKSIDTNFKVYASNL